MSKQKIILLLIAILLLLGLFFFSKKNQPTPQTNSPVEQRVIVISTSPAPLDEATILPDQKIEIKFNQPMVNDPARIKVEPEIKYNATVIGDHSTLEITPLESLKLGQEYTLTIKKDY